MKTDVDSIFGLTAKITDCRLRMLNTLGSGFHDKVYENAPAYELRKQALSVEQQYPPTRRRLAVSYLCLSAFICG